MEETTTPKPEGLSKDEQKIYDRQIRIWGHETQEKYVQL